MVDKGKNEFQMGKCFLVFSGDGEVFTIHYAPLLRK